MSIRSFFFAVGGMCAAAAGFLLLNGKRIEPVQELAHQLEDAWADHHTVV